MKRRCDLPPEGWACTREPGHEGPCAAVPDCGACPGDGTVCMMKCKLAHESPPLPERDWNKPATEQGLFRKFEVTRTDGSDCLGGKHYGCEYYVLDLTHDLNAPHAMRAYANAARASHPLLAKDVDARFGWGNTVEMPFTIKDDVLRYTMEVCGLNNPDGARKVKAVYHAIRDALLHPVGDNGDGDPLAGLSPEEQDTVLAGLPLKPMPDPDIEPLAGQTWQAPVVGADGKLKVVEGRFGKQPCSDLARQLRDMADAVERGEIVDFVAAYLQRGEYETFYAAALDQSLVLASLLQRRCVDRFFLSDE